MPSDWATPINPTLIQSFEWHTPSRPPGDQATHSDASHYARITQLLPTLSLLEVTAIWLPPGCKAGNPNGNGYDCYDLWDLGEFDWKSSRSTKWRSRKELNDLLVGAKRCGIECIWDAVLNHKAAADGTEQVCAVETDPEDRRIEICTPKQIQAWLSFDFAARGTTYSDFKWRPEHFNGTDWDHQERRNAIYKLIDDPSAMLQRPSRSNREQGYRPAAWTKSSFLRHFAGSVLSIFNRVLSYAGVQYGSSQSVSPPTRPGEGCAKDVDDKHGNYDFLMFSNIDYTHPEVRTDVIRWGRWMINDVGVSGFRLDAARHFSYQFAREWIAEVQRSRWEQCGHEAFVVGEIWTGEVDRILKWLDVVQTPQGPQVLAFDSALLYNFSNLSDAGVVARVPPAADLRKILNGTLLETRPEAAVTLVSDRDTQPGQTCYTPMHQVLKAVFYAFILLRKDGYPCVFWGDLFGSKGPYAEPPACLVPAIDPEYPKRSILPDLMTCRKLFAYGKQTDYFINADCIGWTRDGTHDRPGCAVVLGLGPFASGGTTTAAVSTLEMRIGVPGQTWTDVLGLAHSDVTINEGGCGHFPARSVRVGVFVCRGLNDANAFPVRLDSVTGSW